MRAAVPSVAALSTALLAAALPAQIVQRPIVLPQPVHTTLLKIHVHVVDGVATTEIEQTLHNDGGTQGEADWLLPLPPDASADGFTMTVGGSTIDGEVLGAGQARQIYEEIVRKRRDPGLLEYVGTGMLRARVFPIPPQGDVIAKVRFRQVLPESGGVFEWWYPVRAAAACGLPPKHLVLDLTVDSKAPIKTVYAPLAALDVQRDSDHHAHASLELDGGQIPERDLRVLYGTGDGAFGVTLLAHRGAEAPGSFLLLLAPKMEWPEHDVEPRSVTFVLDTSGSMQGDKIAQARDALRFFLRSLRSQDRFNVVPFSTEARPWFEAPVPADEQHVQDALAKIDGVEARGGTNIEDALHTALAGASGDGLPLVVLLTDGQPTVGTTDTAQLLQLAQQSAKDTRMFVFGVGDDVDTKLLDGLAERTGGDHDYVRSGESIEVKTAALFDKLSHPVLTDVRLVLDGVDAFDVLPQALPDLFKGSRLQLTGRYRGTGSHAIRLSGTMQGKPIEMVFETDFPALQKDNDFVPVLWAQRRVAFLLDQIRLHGQSQELVDEITKLGKEYAIVTPYTSQLVVEEATRVAQARGLSTDSDEFFMGQGEDRDRLEQDLRRAGAKPEEVAKVPAAPAAAESAAAASRQRLGRLQDGGVGKDAVDDSVGLSVLKSAVTTGGGDRGDATGLLRRRVGGHTFYLAGGVWVDVAWSKALAEHTRKIAAFSDEWFALLDSRPELAPVLAFSTRLVVVLGDEAIEIQ